MSWVLVDEEPRERELAPRPADVAIRAGDRVGERTTPAEVRLPRDDVEHGIRCRVLVNDPNANDTHVARDPTPVRLHRTPRPNPATPPLAPAALRFSAQLPPAVRPPAAPPPAL